MAGDDFGERRLAGEPAAPLPDPDAGLVAAAVAGDRAAFGTLIERHYDRIHAIAWQLTGSRSDAEDVAQDVCCALVRRIGSFRGEARFSTWLCGITFNACRDTRRRGRAFRGLTDRLAVLAGIGRGTGHADLHDTMWVRSAVAKLPAAYRDAVVLVAGQQLTHAEAAAILGVAEATVSWRLHEARRRLSGADTAPRAAASLRRLASNRARSIRQPIPSGSRMASSSTGSSEPQRLTLSGAMP